MNAEEDTDEFYIEESDDDSAFSVDDFLDFDWDDFYDELEGLDDAEDEEYG